MNRWALLALALCSYSAPAFAQGGLPPEYGFPLVLKAQGWAVYGGAPGEPPVVVRVCKPERVRGRQANCIAFEMDVPGVGRMAMKGMIEGKEWAPGALLDMRMSVPGAPERSEAPPANAKAPPRKKAKLLGTSTERIGGKTIKTLEYLVEKDLHAVWSPDVPGLGIVRTTGETPMRLLEFGVGGDPWEAVARAAAQP